MLTISQINDIIKCLKDYKRLVDSKVETCIEILEDEIYCILDNDDKDDEQEGVNLLWVLIGLLFQQLLAVWLWQEHLHL